MAFLLANIFSFLCVALVIISHAAVEAAVEPSEVYWKTMLPNTPMPKALKDLVHPPEWVNMIAGKGKPISFGASKAIILLYRYKPNRDKVNDLDPARLGDSKIRRIFDYNNQNNDKKSQSLQDPSFKATASALFFLEKKLQIGSQMKLFFTKSTTPLATFLPRDLAKEIPFSSNKFTEILKYFTLKPSSKEAKMMKNTIDDCEVTVTKGEEKQCANSLESMIDFTTSKLGQKVNAISMEANRESDEMQEYTIVGIKKLGGKSIACHKQTYAYAVFYCHSTFSTEAYSITLMGKNGARAKAVGVCHTDTKDWDVDYLAFQVLNVKPGTVPICHLLPQDHVIWVPY